MRPRTTGGFPGFTLGLGGEAPTLDDTARVRLRAAGRRRGVPLRPKWRAMAGSALYGTARARRFRGARASPTRSRGEGVDTSVCREPRGVLMNEHQWRQREGLDS